MERPDTGENAAEAGFESGVSPIAGRPLPKLDASLAGAGVGNKDRGLIF
jgi:hypothetical protein